MSIDIASAFIGATSHDPASAWNFDDVQSLAGRHFPSIFLGDEEPLLRGDQYRLWLRWFLEGLVSPHAYAHDPATDRLDVFGAVARRIDGLYPAIDGLRKKTLADRVTDHLYAEVERLRRGPLRDSATLATKQALLQAASPPRCYLCGYAFSQEAQDALLRVKGRNAVSLPGLVDVFRPRLHVRDISIEIEHMVPVASGGQGQANLQLACGWCNKHKSSRTSLYEAPFLTARTTPYLLGAHRLFELPNPFWMIRILALRGRCRHASGCTATAADSELFVGLRDWAGAPNPTNLEVFCQAHDPLVGVRRQSAASVRALWKDRR